MSDDPAGDDSRSERRGDAEIEEQVRAIYGARIDACYRVQRFGEDALYDWPGRPIVLGSVDVIMLAEASRATKTYAGGLRLMAGGFGPQAMMLNRSLFEGMAVAHWASANPKTALQRLEQHGRHAELLWGDAFEKAEPDKPRTIDEGTPEERTELTSLFGRYGTKMWTGHSSLHTLLPDIEGQWIEGGPRETLWFYYRIANRDANQVLHSTAMGLTGGMTRTTDGLGLDVGPSDHYLDRALIGALWCYMQTMTLLWDHFELPYRERLDELYAAADVEFQREGGQSTLPADE